MTKDELQEILEKHTLWLNNEDGGERANLCGADLRGADLNGVDLSKSDLSGATLYRADLHGANLYGANLYGAGLNEVDLHGANLYGANLRRANLSGANLYGANLSGADLSNAELSRANLCWANLFGANLNKTNLGEIITDERTLFVKMSCPEEGAFIGYKKAREKIIVLEITDDAKRSSATTYKCRCSKAKVLRIENLDGTPTDVQSVASNFDENFVYKVGEIVEVKDFDENRWVECSRGIHFFISKEMARRYQ